MSWNCKCSGILTHYCLWILYNTVKKQSNWWLIRQMAVNPAPSSEFCSWLTEEKPNLIYCCVHLKVLRVHSEMLFCSSWLTSVLIWAIVAFMSIWTRSMHSPLTSLNNNVPEELQLTRCFMFFTPLCLTPLKVVFVLRRSAVSEIAFRQQKQHNNPEH